MFRHFARHSKGSPQAWQTFGANPFLVLATRAGLLTPAFYRSPVLNETRAEQTTLACPLEMTSPVR